MSVIASYDILLRGGRVIDPAAGIDGMKDVAIRNGKIAAVQSDILPTSAREVIDVTGQLVLPGLIDTHGHVFQYVSGRFGMNPDMVGVQSGVTTLIDQGGPSCMTLPAFRHFIAKAFAVCYTFNHFHNRNIVAESWVFNSNLLGAKQLPVITFHHKREHYTRGNRIKPQSVTENIRPDNRR
jgi:predicted amidohydrolase